MKNKSKLNIKLISILLVSIFALTAIFSILNKTNTKKDNSSAKITALEQSLSEAENEILTKNAVINQKNTTIEEQNAVITNQRATINNQSETIESQTATIVNKDETISSQAETIESQTTTINSQADTISNQNTTISNQTSRINTLEEELSSEYNYQYTLDVNFYVDSNLYVYGKARNGGTILVSPTDPVKTNYLFYGWSKTQNGTIIDLNTTIITENTNFYAIFSDDMLALENSIYSVFTSGSTLSTYMEELAFLRSTYHSLALVDTSNMTANEIRVEFGNLYDIENPNSLNYENFLKTLKNRLENYNNYYWIDFRVNNNSICAIRADKTSGLLLRTPTNPSKEDYTFSGWSRTENGTVISNLSQEVFDDSIRLYAVFEAVQETPVFNGTDLTNTRWEINDNFTAPVGYGNYVLELSYAEMNGEEMDYSCFTDLYIGYKYNPLDQERPFRPYTNSLVFMSYITMPEKFTISGGTDVTNTDLISWLESNATFLGYEEPSVNLITFTIDGDEYQAEEGMTWAEWVESDYNIDEFNVLTFISGSFVAKSYDLNYCYNVVMYEGVRVLGDDIIVDNEIYYLAEKVYINAGAD